MMYASDQMMKEGLNSRADKTRQDALRQKEAEEKQRQAKAAEELAKSRFEFDKEQLGHWSKNPEVQGLQSYLTKYVQNYHSAYTNLNTLIADGVKPTDERYQDALRRIKNAEEEVQKINGEFDKLGVPLSMRYNLGNPISSQPPEAQTETQAGAAALPYWQDIDQIDYLTKKLYEDSGGKTQTLRNVEKFLKDNKLDTKNDAAAAAIHKSYKDFLEAVRGDENYESSRKHAAAMRALEIEAAKQKTALGKIDVAAAQAFDNAQRSFLEENPPYSPENAARMATLFKEYKSEEKIGGRGVGAMLGDWLNKKINEGQMRTEYETFLRAMRNKLPGNAEAQTETPPAKTTGKYKF
jgi:hypothetical protein